jgi:hypothetical protein
MKIDISKIKTDFGKDDNSKDEYFIKLLPKVYSGEILCRMALIKTEAINPFVDYQPYSIDKSFQRYFIKQAKEKNHIPLLVYQKDKKFIMSDDYNSYALYRAYGFEKIPCIIIGETTKTKDISSLGKPFHLKRPKFKIIN